MQHHYTDTPDGSPAGAWWQPGEVVPLCAWFFDRRRRLLTVAAPGFSASHRVNDRASLGSPRDKRDVLPLLAFQISRRRARSE
ncbi:MAG TPA: hypothetical protein VL379_02155 [Pseudomonadales bacterium]|jgi:hypothetical protein|nr:hypothetical protein [Pseudomonadales bacterium]